MKNKTRFSAKMTIISVVFALVIIAIFCYSRSLTSYTHEMTMADQIKGVTITKSNAVSRMVKDKLDAVRIAVSMFNEQSAINLLQKESDYDWIRFFDENGNDIWEDGIQYNFANSEYFIKGISGESGVAYVQNSKRDGIDLIAYYSPVKEDKTVIGVMVGFVRADTLETAIHEEILGENADSYLINTKGTIISSSIVQEEGVEVGESFYDYLPNVRANDRASVKSAIEDWRSTAFAFNKGGSLKAYLSPVEGTDWLLVQIFPEQAAKTVIRSAKKETSISLGVLLFALIIIGIFYANAVQQNIKITYDLIRKESGQKNKEELEQAKREAEKASRAKSEFLYNMSHDLRTPLNAIVGFAELAKKTDDIEKSRGYLKKIESSSEHLVQLVNDVLEISKIENGAIRVENVIGFPSEGEEKIVPIFDKEIEKKKLHFTCNLEKGIPPIYWDRDIVYRIAVNLLSNAIKYTPEGGSVSFSSSRMEGSDEDHCILKIVVADTGIGMSEEFVKEAFEPFSREYSTTVSGIQGTGLGLRIVKALVEILDGRITIDSQLGKGTTITVMCEFEYAKDYIADELSDDERDFVELQGKRILLVEDNELNAEIAMELLEEKGFVIEYAENGEVCIEKYSKAEVGYYDLILMDIQMPVLDGYQTTRVIREFEDKEKASIPIIAMTANAFEEDRKAALRAGMNDHVAKPINMKVLLNCIAKNI